MFARRHLFSTLASLPLLGDAVARGDAPKVAAPAPAPVKRTFAPALSGRELMRNRYFPNFELTTSKGEKVRFYDDLLKDKIVILNMMYARCDGVCPITTSNLKVVRKILRQEINHDIFISKMHDIVDPQWLFLTGKPDEVEILRHKVGFSDPDPNVDRDKSRHSGMVRYGNEPLSIWGSCQGSAEPSWIAQEIGFAVPRQYKRHPRVNE